MAQNPSEIRTFCFVHFNLFKINIYIYIFYGLGNKGNLELNMEYFGVGKEFIGQKNLGLCRSLVRSKELSSFHLPELVVLGLVFICYCHIYLIS